MTTWSRILKGCLAAGVLAISVLSVTAHRVAAQPAPQTLTIGVDNAPPAGHNWEFLDFFPRSGVSVHNGDTLHFVFNTASQDGFHTVVLGKPSETPAQIAAAIPNLTPDTVVPDTGDPAGTQGFSAFFGTNPPPGSGAPGACGTITTPCMYTGASEISSGPMPVIGTEFFYKVALTGGAPSSPLTVNYICNVHGPAMNGTFTIVPDASAASTQSDLDAAATTQYNADVAAGQSVESSVGSAAVTTNANGTRTISMFAGDETSDGRVQILEMLPGSVTIHPGDTVSWTAPSRNDPHTVTFPQGTDPAEEPFPLLCDGAAAADTPATGGPPTFGCAGPPGSPTGLEVGYSPAAVGPTTISSTSTAASSGILDSGTYYNTTSGNTPNSYAFTFSNPGTYAYQCRVHDHMLGTVVVAAATVPVPPTGAATGATALWASLVAILGGIAVALAFLRRRFRS